MVAPDYAENLPVLILDCGQNAKEREISSSNMYMCRPNFYYLKGLNLTKNIKMPRKHTFFFGKILASISKDS